jgi:hypothetical protein
MKYVSIKVETYKWCRDRNHLPLVPCLDHRRIQTLDRIAQLVEVTADQLVVWELLIQRKEELHQARGYVLGLTESPSPRQQTL